MPHNAITKLAPNGWELLHQLHVSAYPLVTRKCLYEVCIVIGCVRSYALLVVPVSLSSLLAFWKVSHSFHRPVYCFYSSFHPRFHCLSIKSYFCITCQPPPANICSASQLRRKRNYRRRHILHRIFAAMNKICTRCWGSTCLKPPNDEWCIFPFLEACFITFLFFISRCPWFSKRPELWFFYRVFERIDCFAGRTFAPYCYVQFTQLVKLRFWYSPSAPGRSNRQRPSHIKFYERSRFAKDPRRRWRTAEDRRTAEDTCRHQASRRPYCSKNKHSHLVCEEDGGVKKCTNWRRAKDRSVFRTRVAKSWKKRSVSASCMVTLEITRETLKIFHERNRFSRCGWC